MSGLYDALECIYYSVIIGGVLTDYVRPFGSIPIHWK